jgi:hypothetical protein
MVLALVTDIVLSAIVFAAVIGLIMRGIRFEGSPRALRVRRKIICGFDGVWTRLTGGGEPAGPPVRLGSPPPASHAQPLVNSHN